MHDARLGRFVPGSKRFAEETFGRLGILGRNSRLHFAGNCADGTADLEVMFGMFIRLPVRF